MRVLDLGCGHGLTPQKLDLPSSWEIIGLDVNYPALCKAHISFPHRAFICSAAERLPLRDSSFDRVILNVSLPYMDIAKTLAEAYRVLTPGGTFLASLHSVHFTLSELRQALPKPKAVLYRVWVLANGIVFHCAGRNFGEAFQTERGMRIALERANFVGISFRHDSKRWFVESVKPERPKTSKHFCSDTHRGGPHWACGPTTSDKHPSVNTQRGRSDCGCVL